MAPLSSVQSAMQELGSNSLTTKTIRPINDCHLFAFEENYEPGSPYVCVATSKHIILYLWIPYFKAFSKQKVFDTKEPCSCIHFTSKSVIFGSDSFYEVDLKTETLKMFFDKQDATLAGVTIRFPQFGTFPLAIFEVSSSDEPAEYLICFHVIGVFVNGSGQRSRAKDMKWSKFPFSFAYQLPYLFITNLDFSIEVIEIPPQNATEMGQRAVTLIKNAQYLGPSHMDQSIFLSLCHDQLIELIVVKGSSIGRSAS